MTRLGLLCHPGFGGSVRIALGLAEQLARRGHAVHVFSRTAPLGLRTFPDRVTFHGTSQPACVSPRLDVGWPDEELRTFTDLVLRVSRGARLEVLHFHYALPFAHVAAQVRRRTGKHGPMLVGTLHGTDVRPDGDGRAVKRSLDAADVLTTVSRSHARLARQVFGLSEPPVVIPNFIDVVDFRPGPDGRGTGRRPRMAHVSNFRPVKNAEAVARVFASARREVDAELWLVGDGEAMPAVRALLDRAGLCDDVRFFGLRRDVARILPQVDALLVTSRSESFCLAALEAQACGVPVVAPRVGGLSEVVLDGVTGVLYPDGDEAAATRSVLRLLRSPTLRRRLGEAGAERARLFAAPRIVPRYERLYGAVLGRRPASRAAASMS